MFRLACVLLCLSTPVAAAPIPETVIVPAGPFIAGSDAAEREAAYRLDEAAYGHSRTRAAGWYDGERQRQEVVLPVFAITRTLITNDQYAAFVAETGHPAPDVDRATWNGYGLIHPYASTRRFAWTDGQPPKGREAHPVVLVTHADARAYAAWLSDRTRQTWRLPSELEWEKAARGVDGRRFPWGREFSPSLLNSTIAVHTTRSPSADFPPEPARSACSTPPVRCSNGPQPRQARVAMS